MEQVRYPSLLISNCCLQLNTSQRLGKQLSFIFRLHKHGNLKSILDGFDRQIVAIVAIVVTCICSSTKS